MARLPTKGATVETPIRGKADLRKVLTELCPKGKFSEADTDEIYWALGRVIGQWSAEDDRPDVKPLIKTFEAMSKELGKAVKILSGHESGLRESRDIQIASKLAELLVLDPDIGSLGKANKLIDAFRGDAAKLAHACLVAARDLKVSEVGKSGAPAQGWYDEFTALLLLVAGIAGIEPRLGKDRISGSRDGWLFDAAQSLETFLVPRMRSPSAEACGKRLERSKKRLKPKYRQNRSGV